MKRLFAILLLLLTCLQLKAVTVTATITFTNIPVTSNLFIVNNTTRIWTNAQTLSTIQTNQISTNASKSNLVSQILAYPYPGLLLYDASTNSFTLKGTNVIVTCTNYASVTYATNSGALIWPLEVPPNNLGGLSNRTNNASWIVDYLNRYAATNNFETNCPPLANYATLTTGQTLSNKLIRASALENVRLTNAGILFSNEYLHISGQPLSLNPAPANRGFKFYDSASNAFAIIGPGMSVVDGWPGLYYSNGLALGIEVLDPQFAYWMTNGALLNFKSAFQLFPSIYPGSTNGWNSRNYYFESNYFADIWGTNLHANQITASNVSIQSVNQTNSAFRGTNTWLGSLAIPWYSFQTLGNGNNQGVVFGTNRYIWLNGGITADSSIVGVAGGYSGLEYTVFNDTGYSVTLSQDTVDPVVANRFKNFNSASVILPSGTWGVIYFNAVTNGWTVRGTYPTTAIATNSIANNSGIGTNASFYANGTNAAQVIVAGSPVWSVNALGEMLFVSSVTNVTANYVIATNESGRTYCNKGSAGTTTNVILYGMQIGSVLTFMAETNKQFWITATNSTIRGAGSLTTNSGFATLTAAGDCLALRKIATNQWQAFSIVGTPIYQ